MSVWSLQKERGKRLLEPEGPKDLLHHTTGSASIVALHCKRFSFFSPTIGLPRTGGTAGARAQEEESVSVAISKEKRRRLNFNRELGKNFSSGCASNRTFYFLEFILVPIILIVKFFIHFIISRKKRF